MYFKKLKAGALQLTLFVAVAIAIILFAFILLMQLHKRFDIQTDFIKETIDNAQYGIDYALVNDIRLNDSLSINLNDEDYKSLVITKDFWGVFEKVTAISKLKTNQFKKVALIGAPQSNDERTALYLKDNNKPLVLVGNTKIEGVVYLPKQGVKPGNISGHAYYGSQLIYGTTRISNSLPLLSPELITAIAYSKNNVATEFLDISKNRNHSNSFYNPKKQIYSSEAIILTNITLTGHIEVISNTKIVVDASATLKDIVLIAPEIEIKENVTGNFQSIATSKILVGEHCQLNYPSALILKPKTNFNTTERERTNADTFISISGNSVINGVVIYYGEPVLNNFRPQIIIQDGAVVRGEVYCISNLELKGSVLGAVYTSNFVANESGSIYQNHIYNGNILVNELPVQYVGLLFKKSPKAVAKWLY